MRIAWFLTCFTILSTINTSLLAAEPSPSNSSTVQAGGLTPPGTVDTNKPASSTEQHLDESKEKDSGRGLEWFWLRLGGGYEKLGLETFSGDDAFSAGIVGSSADGGYGEIGLGVRLLVITLGVDGTAALFPDYKFYTATAVAGLHIPLGNVEPYLEANLGYAALSSDSALSADGLIARLGLGFDYYLTPAFSIGLIGRGGVLVLSRASLSTSASVDSSQAEALSESQTSVGTTLDGGLMFGFHL